MLRLIALAALFCSSTLNAMAAPSAIAETETESDTSSSPYADGEGADDDDGSPAATSDEEDTQSTQAQTESSSASSATDVEDRPPKPPPKPKEDDPCDGEIRSYECDKTNLCDLSKSNTAYACECNYREGTWVQANWISDSMVTEQSLLPLWGTDSRLIRSEKESDGEAARVADAGGWVTGSETRRLNGVLAVARAFGDIEYKLWKARAWKKSFAADLVTCEPATLRVPLNRDDEFVVVASDGLWDVIGFAEVAARVRAWRAEKGGVDGAADALASEAIARGNKDNTTVCIVELLWEG